MITSPAFKDKKYAVLGLARSGAAAAEALLASGAEIVAWDRQDIARAPFEGRCTLADPLERDLTGFEAVIVSPGVALNTHPIAGHAAHYGVPIIGDIELFARARPELPAHKVAAITGTNGKSTSVALLAHMLEEAGIPCVLGGNIGEPILGRDPLIGAGGKEGVYVLELSSFQIDLTLSLDCEAAALTNISPDHLDRYAGFEEYAASKARLFEMQSGQNAAIFGTRDGAAGYIYEAEHARRPQGSVVLADPEGLADLQSEWPNLQGPHNLQNASIAVGLAEHLGAGRDDCLRALRSFSNLPHRMEPIAAHGGGITFINDSKATNTASSAPALAAFPPDPGSGPRIHWICGGLAKEEGLGAISDQLGNIAAAYTIGEAGPQFASLLEGRVPQVVRAEMLSEAVRLAKAAAKPGDVVLLSPACASYDQFRDYEKRGDLFRQLVMADSARGADSGDESGKVAGGAAS